MHAYSMRMKYSAITLMLVAFACVNVYMFYINVNVKREIHVSGYGNTFTATPRHHDTKHSLAPIPENNAHAQRAADTVIRLSGNGADINLNFNISLNEIVELSHQVQQLKNLIAGNIADDDSADKNEISRNGDSKWREYAKTLQLQNIKAARKQTGQKPKAFLTLFTSWSNNQRMYDIRNNTVKNWASFKPIINPVLYADDATLAADLKDYGWEVRTVPKSAKNGLPILKYMYLDAINAYDSDFYGFINSDILFTTDIIETLLSVQYAFDMHDDTKPLFVTGQRWNVVNVSQSEIFPRNNLSQIALSRGTLFHSWAEDYFITTKNYPWSDIPEMIISSLGLDNWLVLNARNQKHVVIDSSQTILVVHQSLEGNTYESHSREQANYNTDMLQKLSNVPVPYERGQTNCIERYTTKEGESVVVKTRATLAQFCY